MGCWMKQPQSCSSSSLKERHFLYSPELWSQSGAPGLKTDLRTVILTCRCLWPRAFEGRPLWGKAGYTALHGACLYSVPSGDRSANPASVPGCSGLQRALLSVLPPGNMAELRGSPPICGSLEQLEQFPSASGQRASSRAQSPETGSISRLFGSVKTTAKCVSMGHAHCRRRYVAAFQQSHSHSGGSRAGSVNGTRSEHSLEEGGH